MNTKVSLPIDTILESVIKKMNLKKPVIIKSSPGSGKTTRVPYHILNQSNTQKKILVLIPKRLSVITAATRVCQENNLELGKLVGYAVRFENETDLNTQLIYMTDGLFLKKMNDPEFLNSIHSIIIDEFHERKMNQDLILGLISEYNIVNDPIQLFIMSATINLDQLTNYFNQFDGCEIIEINQSHFKLETKYHHKTQKLILDDEFYNELKKTTLIAWSSSQKDILIFLPGLKEIKKTYNLLRPLFPQIEICILHSSNTLDEQKRILNKTLKNRRILLSTNISESSLTLPDLDCVIDSGLEKYIHYEKKLGFSKLEIQRISLFSAAQREGRAARNQNGICFKMWHSVDERSMPLQIEPELLNSPLTETILFLSENKITNFEKFSWINTPPKIQIENDILKLKKWNLINFENRITTFGKIILNAPLSIEHNLLLIELFINHPQHKDHIIKFICCLQNPEKSDSNSPNNKQFGETMSFENDLDRLTSQPLKEIDKKLFNQISQFLNKAELFKNSFSKINSSNDFLTDIIKIFIFYFPEKIALRKSGLSSLSSSGRGLELSSQSTAIKSDYFICLSGYEKSNALTMIDYALGFSKKIALELLSPLSKSIKSVFFDEKLESFYQQELLLFDKIKLNESSKIALSSTELLKNWKTFIKNDSEITFDSFLKMNSSYILINHLVTFIKDKKSHFNLSEKDFEFLKQFNSKLTDKIILLIDSFEDFKTTDFKYYLDDIVPEEILTIIRQLPFSIQLPSGRIAPINYTDPKAPMISAKIQDFFGWTKHPTITSFNLKLTLQLLAPNMRPTQITNDLENFWKNSYLDVRKDLRARYPKHAWPENPDQI